MKTKKLEPVISDAPWPFDKNDDGLAYQIEAFESDLSDFEGPLTMQNVSAYCAAPAYVWGSKEEFEYVTKKVFDKVFQYLAGDQCPGDNRYGY